MLAFCCCDKVPEIINSGGRKVCWFMMQEVIVHGHLTPLPPACGCAVPAGSSLLWLISKERNRKDLDSQHSLQGTCPPGDPLPARSSTSRNLQYQHQPDTQAIRGIADANQWVQTASRTHPILRVCHPSLHYAIPVSLEVCFRHGSTLWIVE